MTTLVQAGTTTVPAAGPTPGDTIDHGTPRGYRQHKAKGVPYCDECRAAKSERNREYAARPKSPRPKPEPQPVERYGRDCITPGCGTSGHEAQPSQQMVRIAVPGSRELARWYCDGRCAAYGQALAEVRAIPVGGERR